MSEVITSFEDIVKAKKNIEGICVRTPLVYSKHFSGLCGCNVYLKLENLQITGAYKMRGAYNKISSLSKEELDRGVITASAGNHAQGVAASAKMLGIEKKTFVIMAETAAKLKIEKTKSYGVNVELYGQNFDEANDYAHKLADERNLVFIEAFNDYSIIAGQGTIGIEILEDLPDVDFIIVPIGGGGLISGITIAATSMSDKVQIIGVQAETAAPMINSLKEGKLLEFPGPKTMADGIQVGKAGQRNFGILEKFQKAGRLRTFTVLEEEISTAMMDLILDAKIVPEGAGAVSLAALQSHPKELGLTKEMNVVLVVSGGNIQDQKLLSYLMDFVVEKYQFMAVRSILPDIPGSLAQFLSVIANRRINVADVVTHRVGWAFPYVGADEVMIEMVLQTTDEKIQETILDDLKKAGYRCSVMRGGSWQKYESQ